MGDFSEEQPCFNICGGFVAAKDFLTRLLRFFLNQGWFSVTALAPRDVVSMYICSLRPL